MRIKTVLLLGCLALGKTVYAVENPAANTQLSECNTDLVPQHATSKYIEALKCLNGVVATLQTEVAGLKAMVAQSQSDAAEAAARAAAAESAANRAAQDAQDTASKLDAIFRKSMKR